MAYDRYMRTLAGQTHILRCHERTLEVEVTGLCVSQFLQGLLLLTLEKLKILQHMHTFSLQGSKHLEDFGKMPDASF